MARWLRQLSPVALVLLAGHLAFNGFQAYRLRSSMNEERLRAGVEAALASSEPVEGLQRILIPGSDGNGAPAAREGTAPPVPPDLQKSIDDLRREREAGRIVSHAVTLENGIFLVRWAWPALSSSSAAAILENRTALPADLFKSLASSDRELSGASERALYRLTAVGDPTLVFEDQAYRLSIGRCEDLLRERDEAIETAEGNVLPPEETAAFLRRRELRQSIEQDRRGLRAVSLSDTELRIPILKRIRAKEKELAALPAPRPTPTGEALRSFVWKRIGEVLTSERLLAPDDPVAASDQTLKKWVFSAGGSTRLAAKRRALEVFLSVHRVGLVAYALDVIRSESPSIEVLGVPRISRVDSPLHRQLTRQLYMSIGLACGDVLVGVALLFATRGLRRHIRGVGL